jgi:peptidoglycan/xylan/chitin deacetylase (PgdA/CDA1 family)
MSGSPFLMYHRVGAPIDPVDPYTVGEHAFAGHLQRLRAAGYEVTDVGTALERAPGTRPRVVLTFDDGADSDLTVAAPLLRERGFGATFYVVPGLLGRRAFLTAAGVRELASMGFEIGSHSLTHAYLSDLDDDALRREVAGSRERLETIVGRPVRHFSCPGGRCSRRVIAAVRAAGYESLATSHIGLNPPDADPFSLRRLDIQRDMTPETFDRLCRGEGLVERRIRERLLGAAKVLLGNGRYDRVRRALLT